MFNLVLDSINMTLTQHKGVGRTRSKNKGKTYSLLLDALFDVEAFVNCLLQHTVLINQRDNFGKKEHLVSSQFSVHLEHMQFWANWTPDSQAMVPNCPP